MAEDFDVEAMLEAPYRKDVSTACVAHLSVPPLCLNSRTVELQKPTVSAISCSVTMCVAS